MVIVVVVSELEAPVDGTSGFVRPAVETSSFSREMVDSAYWEV